LRNNRGSQPDLPSPFVRSNRGDPQWLDGLPELIERLAARWSLAVEPPFPEIRINYVAPATLVDGTRAVLKVSRHLDDARTEIAALRLWDGDGAARLLEAEPDAGSLLVERLDPGTMLADLSDVDDDGATLIAAEVLRHLWRPVAEPNELCPLESWCDAYERNRDALSRGERGFPGAIFRRADAMRADLLASTELPTVLHGDLHHFNVLGAQRAPWLAIDPKGLVGDRYFDLCQFFRNPHPVPRGVNARRLDIFCAELGLDRARAKAWCFVHAVLDACWSFEDGNAWADIIAYAEETLRF
jgi:streptomycin 6-kinase